MRLALGVAGVRHGGDNAVRPVEAVGGHLAVCRGEIDRRLVHIGVERNKGVEHVGAEGHPFQDADGFVAVRTDLGERKEIVPVDPDGPQFALVQGFAAGGVGIVHGALIVGRQHVLYVFHRDLALRRHAEGDVVGEGRKVRIRAVPEIGVLVEIPLDIPGAGRVVDVVRIAVAAESRAGVEGHAFKAEVQVVFCNKLADVRAGHVLLLFSEGIVQVEFVQVEVVGCYRIAVVGHPAGDPVMAADGLQPPDFIDVGEGDAVHLVGAVGLQQHTQPLYTFPGAADIGQGDRYDILFADSFLYHRVAGKHPLVGSEGLCGGHRNACGVDPGSVPVAFGGISVGHGGVAHGIVREIDLYLRDNGFVMPGLVRRLYDDMFLGIE